MSARSFIIDSGGAARHIARWPIVDSGGTTRLCKRVFIVDSGGTARFVFSANLNATLTAGAGAPNGGLSNIGYDDGSSGFGGASGSLSSTAMPFGTVTGVEDVYLDVGGGPGYLETTFNVSSASDPGIGAFASLTISPGATLNTASSGYSYSGGIATWLWTSGPYFTNGNTYTVTTS